MAPGCCVLTCCCLQAELLLHVERLVQSVKALCSSLAAIETPEVTSALSQLPACPCRLQPRVLKVNAVPSSHVTSVALTLSVWVLMKCLVSCLASQDASVLAVKSNRGMDGGGVARACRRVRSDGWRLAWEEEPFASNAVSLCEQREWWRS